MNCLFRNTTIVLLYLTLTVIATGCNGNMPKDQLEHRNPQLHCSTPIEDESTHLFSFEATADSANNATLHFELFLHDSLIAQNDNGLFHNIEECIDGYTVKFTATWPDTTIIRSEPVQGFVCITPPTEKMTAEELEHLINSCDKSIRSYNNDNIAQGVELHVEGSQLPPPEALHEVIFLIENEEWPQGVRVSNVEYNDKNQITSITISPVKEVIITPVDDDDVDY